MGQIHKRFTDDQIRQMIQRYLSHEIERKYVQSVLGVGKSRFFELIHSYRQDPKGFSIQYHRQTPCRQIDPQIDKNIFKELKMDQQAILNKDIPLRRYNYSYVRGRLKTYYQQQVSLSTVIARAKKYGFYLKERKHMGPPV